jgi:hypothetical protein
MSTPGAPPPPPRGSHRAAPAGGEAAGSPLLLPVLSVLVVLGAIGLAAWMLLTAGDGDNQADSPAPVTQPTAEPSDTGSAEPTKDDTKKDDTKKDDTKKDDTKKDNTKKDNTKKDDTKKDTAPVPQLPVYVFNQTTITGLAAETANSLESAGWNVVGVDNWIGRVPSDTVYFYPGDRAAAERLSKDFPEFDRVWPASAPMPAGALSVILADTARK